MIDGGKIAGDSSYPADTAGPAYRAAIRCNYADMTAGIAEIDRKIDAGIADIRISHASQNIFHCSRIVDRRRIEFNITDVPCIGIFVIYTFTTHFFLGADGKTDRNME